MAKHRSRMEGRNLKANMSRRSTTTNEKAPMSENNPTPSDLDRFVPWMFKELQSTQAVVVIRKYQEDYLRKNVGRKNISRVFKNDSSRLTLSDKADLHTNTELMAPTAETDTSFEENTIQLIACYNRGGQVVEIAINDCSFPINRQLIETISLCLPFHNMFNKLTSKGKGLDCSVIDEIAKMLPLSHLTDICLDNTFVPQGNYYILLDQASTLKCLSLSKCRINDVVCKKIADRLVFGSPASKNLLILCLSCNFITDVGAQALGHALRTNRHILHLNLCGNRITTIGVGHLLEPLSEFMLTIDEVREKIRRRWDYYKRRAATMLKEDSPNDTSIDLVDNLKMRGSFKKKSQLEFSDTVVNVTELYEKTAEDYVFGPSNTVFKNGCWYTSGNLVLCSLNLGYNDLDYTSLPKIINVLSYQKEQEKSTACTGLLRMVIEGNNLPVNCEEYSKINTNLDIMRNEALSLKKKRDSSTSRRTRRSTSTVHVRSPSSRDNNSDINSPPRA